MATTGFWPVKVALVDVLKYEENPDKTTDLRWVDEDLLRALQYVERDDKTDRKLFVSGIHCSKTDAYADMTATKKRFGKLGGNVAYHGYQSFRSGEVTPEECHRIGLETARAMWGEDYEILVTTHLNTQSLHNHFVVNSVSFRTGRKFENHVSDHYRLREISDRICREHGLDTLENKPFAGSTKGAHRMHQKGKRTHRDILRDDIEYCIRYSEDWREFGMQLRGLGYTIDWERFSVKAPDWERAVRLDRLGYSEENIKTRLDEHRADIRFFHVWNAHLPYRPKGFPLLSVERMIKCDIRYCKSNGVVVLDVLFYAFLQLLGLAQSPEATEKKVRPLSPSVRMELAKLDQILKEYQLLIDNGIHTDTELKAFMERTQEQIALLEHSRQGFRNQLRHQKSPEAEAEIKAKRDACTEQLKPLREELRCAKNILTCSEKLYEIMLAEREMETRALARERERTR